MYPGRALGRTTVATDGADETDPRVVERRAIEAVLDGERAAFRVLVERHHRGVQAMMQRFVHNLADAEDLAQSAFVAAFDALGSFDVEQRFSTWLYRIAINLAKDHSEVEEAHRDGAADGRGARGGVRRARRRDRRGDAGAPAAGARRAGDGHALRRGSRDPGAQGPRGAAVRGDQGADRAAGDGAQDSRRARAARLKEALEKLAPREAL